MRERIGPLAALLAVALAVASPGVPKAGAAPVAPDFATAAEALDFLRTATIVSSEQIPVGITEPRKLLLERDGVRAHAIFRDVEMQKDRVRLRDGSFHMLLRDSALFEVAAYRLAALLGLDNVPPTVVRKVRGTTGSLQLWVNGAMTEAHRVKNGIEVPDRGEWLEQMRLMTLFDTLVANIDRHSGNYLHAPDGKLWFIDHTRAFQMFPSDWSPRKIAFCQRDVWERLQRIDRDLLMDELGDVLQLGEINKLEARIEEVVEHIRAQIAARGEAQVILDGAEVPYP